MIKMDEIWSMYDYEYLIRFLILLQIACNCMSLMFRWELPKDLYSSKQMKKVVWIMFVVYFHRITRYFLQNLTNLAKAFLEKSMYASGEISHLLILKVEVLYICNFPFYFVVSYLYHEMMNIIG